MTMIESLSTRLILARLDQGNLSVQAVGRHRMVHDCLYLSDQGTRDKQEPHLFSGKLADLGQARRVKHEAT